jgi:hypothetical protein
MSKELQMRKVLWFIPILVIFVAFGASTAKADNILYSVTLTTSCAIDACPQMESHPDTQFAMFPDGWGDVSTRIEFDIAGNEYAMSVWGGAGPGKTYGWTYWGTQDGGTILEVTNLFNGFYSYSNGHAPTTDSISEGGIIFTPVYTPVPEISSAVPEPGSLPLALCGLGGLGLLGLMSVRKRFSLIDNSR